MHIGYVCYEENRGYLLTCLLTYLLTSYTHTSPDSAVMFQHLTALLPAVRPETDISRFFLEAPKWTTYK